MRPLITAGAFCSTLALSATLHAQQQTAEPGEPAPPSGEGNQQESSTVTYDAEFFEQYDPNTVNDMLDWIPGISLALDGGGGGGDRGLGGEESILINGQRMAGKSNDAQDQLSRIPAGEVDHIEIIRGSSGDLAVRSSGQIVNIVLTSTLERSSITAEVNADRFHDGTVQPGGSFSYSRQQGPLNYLFSISGEPRYELRESFERNYHGDWTPNGAINRDEQTDQFPVEVSTNITYDLTPADRIQFNALFEQADPPQEIDRIITDLNTDPPTRDFEREDIDATEEQWEIGGNYEHLFTGGSRFRILAIATREDDTRFRERFIRDNRDDEEFKDLALNTGSVSKERIVRSSFTWNMQENHDLEMGVEGAQNILDSRLSLGEPGADGPATPETGGLPAVDVPNSDSVVEEIRYEPFVVHNWQINPDMTLETSLVGELSEIEQTGDTNKKRDFTFLNPSLDFRYNLTSDMQLRARAEKQVSQLSFGQFVASADPNDEQQDTEAGNPSLSQEETWRYELNFEYRLPNDLGVINSQVFYEDIENVIDRVDLTPNADTPTPATGNIGEAEKYGLEIDTSTRLGFIGLPEALVTTNLQIEDSSVTDPVLGIDRRLEQHGRGRIELGFRHDIPSRSINYGFDYNYGFRDGNQRFDVQRIESFNRDPFLTVFVQKTAFDGVVFRLESMNALDNGRCRERRRFDGRTSEGTPFLIENSCSTSGRKVALKIRTTF